MAIKKPSIGAIQQTVGDLDSKLFGENTLSTTLLKSYITMGVLILILPTLLDTFISAMDIENLLFYVSLPALTAIIVLVFIYRSIRKHLSPIKGLLISLRKIEVGDFDVDLNLSGYMEIEHLAHSVDLLRNSLSIAQHYLGKRESLRDKSILDKAMSLNLSLILFSSYAVFGIFMIMMGSFFYTSEVQEVLEFLPYVKVFSAIIVVTVGLVFAIGVGYVLSNFIGEPMRKLAINAEKVSRGDFEVEFNIGVKGELGEVSEHLENMSTAIFLAYTELEQGV